MALITCSLGIAFLKKIMYKVVKYNIKHLETSGRLPYNPEGVLIFGQDQIQDIASDSETITKYSCIESIDITEKAIYIYINSIQAIILPVSLFSSEEEKEKFLQFLNSKT